MEIDLDATLSRQLVDLGSFISRLVKQGFNGQVNSHSPTLTQVRILSRIKRGARHVGKLSEVLGISQPATSIMINKLVKTGYLKRAPHATDRRQIELRLTAKANSHLDTGYDRIFAKIEEKFSSLSASKKKALVLQVSKIFFLLSSGEQGGED